MAWRLALPRPMADALRWWTGELAAMVPPWAQRVLWRQRRRLLLPAASVLVRRAGFPLAAEENLREVIAFEMDRVLPFQADEVYFDFIVRTRDAGQGRLVAEIAAARRAVVDEAVARADGPLSGVGVDGLDPRLDLCPPRLRRPWFRRADMVVLGLGAALLAAAAVLPLHRLYARIETLEAEAAAVRADAAEAERLRREVEESLAAERLMVESRLARPTALAVLEETSRLIPDDAWLQQFRMTAEGIEFQGVAAASAQLLRAVEDSAMFGSATFRAPVTQDSQGGRERFSLGAKWEGASR